MKFSYLTYSPKVGGASNGMMMLHVGLEGGDEPPSSIITDLKDASKICHPLSKAIIFEVNYDAEEAEVSQLFRLLKDYGAYVGLTLGGESLPSYKDDANHVIAWIEQPDWINFKTQEIIYEPPTKAPLQEPTIEHHNIQADKTLLLNHRRDGKEVMEFLRASRFMWRYHKSQKSIEIDFIK